MNERPLPVSVKGDASGRIWVSDVARQCSLRDALFLKSSLSEITAPDFSINGTLRHSASLCPGY